MRFTALSLVATLASAAIAAPVVSQLADIYNFSPALAEFYARVSNHIGAKGGDTASTCDTSGIALPADALVANGLGPIPAGQVVQYVAIGRGTQVCICSNTLKRKNGIKS